MKKICVCVFTILLCLGLFAPSVKADVGSFDINVVSSLFALPGALPVAIIGQDYSQSFLDSTGAISFTYIGSCTPIANITGLPPGITSSNNIVGNSPTLYFGTVSMAGTPTQTGNYTIVLNLSDGCGATASQSFPLEVGANFVGRVAQVDTNILGATVGVPYSTRINCGPTDPIFNLTGLPPGITAGFLIGSVTESYNVNPQTGCPSFQIPLSGTAQTSGHFSPVLTITNEAGTNFIYPLGLTVEANSTDTSLPVNPSASVVKILTNAIPKTITVGVPLNKGVGFTITGNNSIPIISITGLPPGITVGSLIIVNSSLNTSWYIIPLKGTSRSPGNFKPILTITDTGSTSSSYVFPLGLLNVKAQNSNATSTPTPTSQDAPQPILTMASPSSSPATVAPIQATQSQAGIITPAPKPVAQTSKIKLFFSAIGNFFKGIGRWFKR